MITDFLTIDRLNLKFLVVFSTLFPAAVFSQEEADTEETIKTNLHRGSL